MKNVLTIALFSGAFIFGSCNNNDTAIDNTLVPANATKPVTPVTIADTLFSDTTTATSGIKNNSVITNSPNTPVITSPQTTPVIKQTSVTSSKNTAGLNPAHGQPGHRCDISVGAPLSTPVKTAAAPTMQASPVTTPVTTPVIQPQVNQTGVIGNGLAKINPPHGQPGHDCAVKVGDPLKN